MFRPIQFLSLALLIALIGNVSAFVSYANAQLIDSIVIYYGESDDDAIAKIPDFDITALASMDESLPLPTVIFLSPNTQRLPESKVELSIPRGELPDSLLLYSNGYYGERLATESAKMGVNLDEDRLRMLETICAVRGINTRLLLTLAKLKKAPERFVEHQDWSKWLLLETSRIRTSLIPSQESQTILFSSSEYTVESPDTINTVSWPILASLSAGETADETQKRFIDFLQTYQLYFGDPYANEVRSPSASPFLYKPYRVSLTGRGYYDHQYPSVDNNRNPNVYGMLDYLGRTDTNYDTHDGDDFWMPYGSDVFAPQAGQVVYFWDGGTGNKGIILYYAGDTSYEIIIWHMSEVYVSLWQNVSLGQQLGKSGIGGGVNHIHFEIRHGGKQTDTMGWYGNGGDPCPAGPGPTGNYRGCETSSWLWLDENPPDRIPPVTTLSLSGTLGDHEWYVSSVQATLSATDISGISQIQYKLDTGDWQTYSAPFTVSGDGQHTVSYKSQDAAGNWESEKSTTFSIDTLAPTGSLLIQNGSAQTYSALVNLTTTAADSTSGMAMSRFRDPGQAWSDWFAYPMSPLWSLSGQTGDTLSIEAQFKDLAGNLSTVYADTITLNLYPDRPASSNFRMSHSTFGASGVAAQSSMYQMNGTSGQPSMIGAMNTSNYRLVSGYWAAILNPEPAIPTPTATSIASLTPTAKASPTRTITSSPTRIATSSPTHTVTASPTRTPNPTRTKTTTPSVPPSTEHLMFLPFITR